MNAEIKKHGRPQSAGRKYYGVSKNVGRRHCDESKNAEEEAANSNERRRPSVNLE